MENAPAFTQGMEVTVITFGGKRVRRRVWEELSTNVLVCKEEEDQRARKEPASAICTGIPKENVVEIHSATS